MELASRLRRSPAGLGHSTGQWRVSPEQMVGVIDISRENTNLDDAANRNGIQEGAGFTQLKNIILFTISEFEQDRQSIGRKLAEYKREKDATQKEIERMQQLAEQRRKWEAEQKARAQKENEKPDESDKKKQEAPTANPEEVEKLLESIKEKQEEEVKELQDEIKMLQTLATTGIVTNMFMHEIRTLTNNIGQELD